MKELKESDDNLKFRAPFRHIGHIGSSLNTIAYVGHVVETRAIKGSNTSDGIHELW